MRLCLLAAWLLGLVVVEARAPSVDESLYSRQLYVLGLPAQQRLATSHVLVVGLTGLGVEIAKNIILAGPRSVTIFDPEVARSEDLASQYYLGEESVGKRRDAESFSKLQGLNPQVEVHRLNGPTSDGEDPIEWLTKQRSYRDFDVIVTADLGMDDEVKIDEMARSTKAKLVTASCRGVFGRVFCDFGDSFTVLDTDGEPPKSGVLQKLVYDEGNQGVRCVTVEKHDLQVGDKVAFEEMEGVESKDQEPFKVIKVIDPTSFIVQGLSKNYASGNLRTGRFLQIKEPEQVSFHPLSRAMEELPTVPCDFTKSDPARELTLHACFHSLGRFRKEHGRLPTPGSASDAELLRRLVKTGGLMDRVTRLSKYRQGAVDERLVEAFSRTCRGSIAPMCSFIGGTAAQEVLKACTGSFMPLRQFLYFDAVEALSETLPSEADCAPVGDRYDGQRAIFGERIQRILHEKKAFVVGAGAIGCELLKNFALMGLGQVTITDNDVIEKSNLNRQFLFREKDLGSPKSEAAARAIACINPGVAIRPLTKKVGNESENFFNDQFWADQDVVANALDNVAARLYVDSRCVYYRKPLLESGTLGTKGNVQVVVPDLTESYGSSSDPPEPSIPVCTLKSFPYEIEHCIQWARDAFDGYFRMQPERVNEVITAILGEEGHEGQGQSANGEVHLLEKMRSQSGDETILRSLERVLHDLEIWEPIPSFRKCVKWALDLFYELYHTNIKALLAEHPLESTDEEGLPFWSGTRKVPTPITFDASDRLHLDFIITATLLKCKAFNVIEHEKEGGEIEDTVKTVLNEILSEYKPVELSTVEHDMHLEPEELDARIHRALNEIKTLLHHIQDRPGHFSARPEVFEKDVEGNGHMEFVTTASNLRAAVYGIPPADRLQTKKIAGRIIPAIATTTSVVAGLACLELLKLIQDKPLEDYKNAFVNLAGTFFALTQPVEAPVMALGNKGKVFTMWDRLEMSPKRDLVLKDLLAQVHKLYGLKVTSMTLHGSKLLYADFLHTEEDPVLSQTMTKLAAPSPDKRFVDLEIECVDEEQQEVDSPPVRYYFPTQTSRWNLFKRSTGSSALTAVR